jgi:RNA polymerase sigma factor (sigma-70 family)
MTTSALARSTNLRDEGTMTSMDEENEAAEVASPTDDVVRALVENQRAFLSFLERRTGDPQLARDILQEAFARSIEKVHALRDDEAAIAWFYRTLRNAVIDMRRRRSAADKALANLEDELADAVEPEPEVRNAVCACVARIAGTLKPEYEQAIRRIEVDGVAVGAYAAEAGITPGNASVRLFRARKALRERVVRSCGACATHGCVDCTCRGPAPS